MRILPCYLCALCALCGHLFRCDSAEAEVLAWAFEATVIDLDNEHMTIADVRLGDTLRGTFRYDLSIAPDPTRLPAKGYYAHPLSFTGIELALENPRTGDALEWLPDRRHPGDDYHVIVASNNSANDGGEIYLAETMQLAEPSMMPWWVVIEFASPKVLPDISLPTEYTLDDWSTATVHLAELSYFDGLSAQIYSLTPLSAPTLPGDYDSDGFVTSADYVVWRDMLGQAGTGLAADGNGDSVVDQADYSVWRAYFGTTEVNTSATASAVAPNPITEPGTVVMLLFVALPRSWRLRRPTRNG